MLLKFWNHLCCFMAGKNVFRLAVGLSRPLLQSVCNDALFQIEQRGRECALRRQICMSLSGYFLHVIYVVKCLMGSMIKPTIIETNHLPYFMDQIVFHYKYSASPLLFQSLALFHPLLNVFCLASPSGVFPRKICATGMSVHCYESDLF